MNPEAQWISLKEALDFGSDREVLPKHAYAKILDALVEEHIRSRARVFIRRTSESSWQSEDQLLHGWQWKLANEQDYISFYESMLRYSIDVDNGIGQIFRDVYSAIDVEVYRPHLKNIWPEAGLLDSSEPTSKPRAKNAGGRPHTHDWAAAAGAAVGYLHMRGVQPEDDLVRWLKSWFKDQNDKQPDHRDVRNFATALLAAVNTVDTEPDS